MSFMAFWFGGLLIEGGLLVESGLLLWPSGVSCYGLLVWPSGTGRSLLVLHNFAQIYFSSTSTISQLH